MFTANASVIDDNRLIKCKLGDVGNVNIERIDKSKVKLHFLDSKNTHLNIMREYPDGFWNRDYYTNKFITTLSTVYNLDNGVGDEIYSLLQQDINSRGGVPTLEEIDSVFNDNLILKCINGDEVELDLETTYVKCITPSEIPKRVRKIFDKFENPSGIATCKPPLNPLENSSNTQQRQDDGDVIDVNKSSITTHMRVKKVKSKNSVCSMLCKYRVRYESKADIYDRLPKSVTLRMKYPSLNEIIVLILDKDTFFRYNEKLKQIEKSADNTAEFILNTMKIITLDDTNEMFYYEDGIYKPKADKRIREFCSVIFLDTTSHFKDEVVKHVIDKTYIHRIQLEHRELLCLDNGILNAKTLELNPHSSDYYFLDKLPLTYDPKATCPKIDEFLSQILYKDDIPCIEEVIGYCLLREYIIHKAIMLYGSGRNGKTTLINLIVEFLGEQNIANKSLHDLVTDRFATADLFGKMANLFADIPRQALHETDIFKTLTGNDYFSAQHKFLNSFQMKSYATLIFSTNNIPETYDRSDAFFARWVLIKFPHQFYGVDADPNLHKQLSTKEELSGLLNKALVGLKRLLKNGDLTGSKSIEDIKADYTRTSDSARAYCDFTVKRDPEGRIPKSDLYAYYSGYCIKNKLTKLNLVAFGRKIPEIFPGVTDGRPVIDGERKTCWFGISLKEEDDKIVS